MSQRGEPNAAVDRRGHPSCRATLLAALLAASLAMPAPAPASAAGCTVTTEAATTIEHVASADELVLAGGARVKLIGALPLPTGPMASVALANAGREKSGLASLLNGATVELAVSGRRFDRYGRLMAQVFVVRPPGPTEPAPQRTWLQGQLVADGLARAYALPGDTACLVDLLRLEDEARAAARGHWATGAFADRDAAGLTELKLLAGTFQSVVGRIERIDRRRDQLSLVFAGVRGAWTEATLSAADAGHGGRREGRRRSRTADDGDRSGDLVGATVRVRGWIERAGSGVQLRLSSRAEIEMLAAPTAATVSPGESASPDDAAPMSPTVPLTGPIDVGDQPQ